MTPLTRVTGKVFGGNAPLSEVGVFGSAKAGNPTNATDIATIQGQAAYLQGWGSGIVSSQNFPPMEEVTGVLKTISYQTCYLLQEGPQLYDINTEYSNTSIVKDIVGNNLRFYLSKQNGNIGHPLSDEDWWQLATFTGTNPIGAPQFTLNPNAILPNNCIWLEGATVSRIDYNNLFAIYGTTYGAGNGSTTFNLPDFRDRTIWGADSFGYISAGLPNITGQINYPRGFQNTGTQQIGALSYTVWGSDANGLGNTDGAGRIAARMNIDASLSSSVYGASNTVQPPAIKVRVYTRYQ